jgi:catechol 2,3-dioxygenase-like lactoylglutathione lyase family enzyme
MSRGTLPLRRYDACPVVAFREGCAGPAEARGLTAGRREEKNVADEPAIGPEMRLELVPIPVADVDRAKAFYATAGFGLEVDTAVTDTMRVVQLTPPGSRCSIVFGTGMPGISDMQPGSLHGLHLVVADIRQAREALVERGVEVDDVIDTGGVLFAAFRDPDGNTWLLQEFPPGMRSPGQSFYAEEP